MLFGTDGIRGEVVDSPLDDEEAVSQLLDDRMISARLMRLVGEALTRVAGMDNTVIIGWDDRPRNSELVAALTVGLHLGGCKVIHGGICATPGLHNSVFETNSSLGCMITASHNPVSDSGIKVFDSNGYKTNPELEIEISELIVQLAAEEREVDNSELVSLELPDSIFDADFAHQELLKIRYSEFSEMFAPISPRDIVLDSSKGAASTWLAGFLSEFGIIANEVSKHAPALNDNCGAGEIKPTDSWTWEDAKDSEHIMIRSLKQKPAGQIIAAALDGDGDRCLLVESTENGCKVVDGDEMADHILRSVKQEWHLAASIESDLALASSLQRLNSDVKFSQTAVGDRWLSHALKDSGKNVLGVEDSGHLVMSAPNPNGGRVLVGDGVASMFAVLCAMSCENRTGKFQRGFKNRISISPSNRSKWDGKNSLADKVEEIANNHLGEMARGGLVGESNLMLLEKEGISIGVRNSGTQAKTNVSLRVSPGIDHVSASKAVAEITELLSGELQD